MSAQYPVLYDRPINKWKVAELKEELKKRSLPVRGLKDELVRRLDESIRNDRENLVAQEEAISDHMKEQLGSGEGILSEKENLGAQGQGDLHYMEEPLGEYNHPIPPSHTEQIPVVAREEDVNDAIVDNPVSEVNVVDGSSEKNYLGPANNAKASLIRRCGSENGNSSNTVAVNEETEVVLTATTGKASDIGTELLKPDQMDAKSHVTQSSSQVYEVSSNLGFQVQCESITADNVNLSNIDKTEIKENIHANNIQLEPEVNRQELVVQLLSHTESAGDGDKVPDVKQGYIVEADDKCIIKSSEKTYSADNVSVIDQIMDNNAPDQVADDTELVQSAANLDGTVKSDVPLECMEPSGGNRLDFVASVGQKEQQDDKSSVANFCDVGLTTEEPHEKMNQSSADDPMEEDNILDKDLNSNKDSDKNKSTEEISVNEALPADTPAYISESYVVNSDAMVSSSEARKLDDGTIDAVEQRELQDDKSSEANNSEREPLEKINLDQSDDSMEDDILDMKHTDSDYNPNKGGDETMSTEEITVNPPSNEALQANISLSSEKRKFEGEPASENKEIRKRQRRWNTESVKLPDQKGSDASLSKAAVASSGPNGPKLDGADLTQERVVPPSSKTPTDSLRIDNFVRPFTLKAVQELLSKTGTYSAFWMDSIKTHCYVTFTSVDEATATRDALYNLQWPENGGRLLVAEFVDPEEVKSRFEPPSESAAPVQPSQPPARQVIPANSGPVQPPKHPAKQVPVHQRVAERVVPAPAPAPVEEPIDSVKTLDDLFRKTKATPRIYYLPLSDEQVALKLGKQKN